MPDASPIKWHLAHVTWFFEIFVLEKFEPAFKPCHPAFRVLFNSYYNAVGDKHPRLQRGLLTRPSLDEVRAWRRNVDERMTALMHGQSMDSARATELSALIELGLNHEQQHQELILTEIQHLLSMNPLAPVYRPAWPLASIAPSPVRWLAQPGGLIAVGHHANDGFSFDNECPRHSQWLAPYALMNRLVTHGEWLAFMQDGGYRDPRWWLSAGWDWVQSQRIEAPLYWRRSSPDNAVTPVDWHSFTLHGLVPIDVHTPITTSVFSKPMLMPAGWQRRAAPSGVPACPQNLNGRPQSPPMRRCTHPEVILQSRARYTPCRWRARATACCRR